MLTEIGQWLHLREHCLLNGHFKLFCICSTGLFALREFGTFVGWSVTTSDSFNLRPTGLGSRGFEVVVLFDLGMLALHIASVDD